MKEDKFSAIFGNPLVTPEAKLPTIAPTNAPIAVPICDKALVPSVSSQLNPGICERPPRIANIAAIPPTTAANPTTPVNAPVIGIVLIILAAILSSKNILETVSSFSSRPPKSTSPNADVSASVNEATNFCARLTTEVARSGIRSARPSMRPTRTSAKRSTNCGI